MEREQQVKLFIGQKHNLSTLQRLLGVDKNYLYRFVKNPAKVRKMPFEIVLGISKIEKIEPNELYNKMLVYSLQRDKNDI